jgi:ribosomal protein S19E (S16A)
MRISTNSWDIGYKSMLQEAYGQMSRVGYYSKMVDAYYQYIMGNISRNIVKRLSDKGYLHDVKDGDVD